MIVPIRHKVQSFSGEYSQTQEVFDIMRSLILSNVKGLLGGLFRVGFRIKQIFMFFLGPSQGLSVM